MIDWASLEAANAALNAFTDFDRKARGGDGPLADLTVGVKANIAVQDMPWTAGLDAFRDRTAERDAEVVCRLRHAGAAIIGMLNMEEAALGAKTDNPWFGATQNPHKPGYTPGGSSGGSGAAVAAGLCDIALGTDTMGSVRIPAAYCGVYGFKPARGALSQDGLEIVDASLDGIGPLARSLETLERAARVMMDFAEPQAIENIALLDNLGGVECQPGVLSAYRKAADFLEAQSSFALPYALTRIRFAGFILSTLGLSKELHAELSAGGTGLSDTLKKLISYGTKRSEDDLAEDKAILQETSDAMIAIVAEHGAILLPTAPQTAFPHAQPAPANQAVFTCLANISGLPAISIPAGLDTNGLPLAVQLIGEAGNEAGLFALAHKLDAYLAGYNRPKVFWDKQQKK
ncbi:amidase [Alterisphingorhabdus coralli]|uniref:Amidase n=1 Tax=Alterisphingorhabdus coralli TaxID=3071408 RepID=A0AA97F6Q7_9SPHN|nr:amidase [Parasphingorhabdus sp. SCSIO 66989]WOE75384.1 amidase [Parasphingorhabdus sp. SCSIO 66989]